MSAPVEMQDMVSEVVHTYPQARVEFHPLPSGVCFLWVTVCERNFVIEYGPNDGTGVSENFPDTPAFVGHDEVFASLSDAIRRFKGMLAEAARTQPANAFVLHDKKSKTEH